MAEYNIKRANIDGTNITILTKNTVYCEGLAVEWTSSHLYWIDRRENTISASDLDGNNTRILVSSQHYNQIMSGIVLDPFEG